MDAAQPPLDADAPAQEQPRVLVNENPFSGSINTVTEFLQAYGWFFVVGVIVVLYLKSKLSPKLEELRRKVEIGREKKLDNETAQSRLEAMDAARRRMQAQLDEQAAKHAEQMKEKEEEKRKQKIEDWDNHLQGKGYRSKVKLKEGTEDVSKTTIKKSKNTLRQADYNPLTGDGGSCAWRPGSSRGARGGG